MARCQHLLELDHYRCPLFFPFSVHAIEKRGRKRDRLDPLTKVWLVVREKSVYLFESCAFNVALALYGQLLNQASDRCVQKKGSHRLTDRVRWDSCDGSI